MKNDFFKNKNFDYFLEHASASTNDLNYLKENKEFYNNLIKKQLLQIKNISIVIICKNEERCIERCLNSIFKNVHELDEVLVIDTGSTDNTIEIIQNKFPKTRLEKSVWKDDFSIIRNNGLTLAKNDWIFFIDADEILDDEALDNLKLYLAIIEAIKLKNIILNPIIINDNYHVIRGVRRIINKNDKITYYGYIHEEPRLNKKLFGNDISCISFDNIILYHDGYNSLVIKNKDKIKRNTELLSKMIRIEPEYPRWLYFYCRDGKEILEKSKYIELLNKVIKLSNNKEYEQYYIRALSDLIDYYLSIGNLETGREYIEKLKLINPEISDVFYFEIYTEILKLKHAYNILLNKCIEYRESRVDLDYGSMHSNYFHIDYLIGKLFFEIGKYEHSFNLISKLEKNKFNDFKENYKLLYRALQKYYINQ